MMLCEQHKHLNKDVGCWVCRAQLAEAQKEQLEIALDMYKEERGAAKTHIINPKTGWDNEY
jgi:hypothetical protein